MLTLRWNIYARIFLKSCGSITTDFHVVEFQDQFGAQYKPLNPFFLTFQSLDPIATLPNRVCQILFENQKYLRSKFIDTFELRMRPMRTELQNGFNAYNLAITLCNFQESKQKLNVMTVCQVVVSYSENLSNLSVNCKMKS